MASAVDVLHPLPAMQTFDAHAAEAASLRSPSAAWDIASPNTFLISAQSATQPRSSSSALSRASSKSRTTHARLHKRVSASAASPSVGLERIRRSTTDLSTPSLVSSPLEPSGSQTKSPPLSAKTTREQIRKNFRWLGKDSEQDEHGIDLSRTVAENEERISGLGLSMQSPVTEPSMATSDDIAYRVSTSSRAHRRSVSHTSAASNVSSGSFKPTAPFVHPYKNSPTLPATSPSTGHSVSNSISETDSYFPSGEPGPTGNMDGDSFTPARSTPSSSRPSLRLNTSAATAASRIRSSSYTVTGPGAHGKRPRRATDLSVETSTPPSRTSLDRAFSFMRGADSEPMDSMTKAATIQAARQAFDERQEAKDRKWEKHERKAAERAERQAEKHEDRLRRKSESADKKRSSNVVVASAEEPPMPKSSVRRPSTANKLRSSSAPTSAKQVHFKTSMSDTATRTKKSVKNKAKTNNALFWLWFRTRLFQIGRNASSAH